MRRAASYVVVIAALAACIPAATVAHAAPVLVVSGTGPTMTEFTTTAAMSFQYSSAIISGDGRYAGLTLYAASGRAYGGVVSLPELSEPARPLPLDPPTVFAGAITTLPAGRYRAYLLAEKGKRAEIRLPLKSGDGVTVETDKPIRQTYKLDRHPLAASETKAAVRLPLSVNARTKTYMIARFSGGTAEHDVRVCPARRGRPCGPKDGGVANHGLALGTTQSGVGLTASELNGLRDARAEVSTKPAAVPNSTALLGLVVLQFDLVK